MKPKKFDFDLAVIDDNGLAEAQAVASATTVALDGALIAGGTFTSSDGMGRRLCIVSGGDDLLVTFTVVGTDSDGHALTEVVTGANAGTAESTKYFKTVSSITTSAAVATTVAVGTVDEASSQIIPLDAHSSTPATIHADITGTIDYTINQTFDLFQDAANGQSVQWSAITAFSAKTADVVGAASVGATGIQLVVNTYTDTAEAQIFVSQPSS